MQKLGVGIVGCGWVAGEHIKAFAGDGRAEVRALVDADKAAAGHYKDEYGLACSIGTDYQKMLKQEDIDIVVVCTPNDSHAEISIAAAEAKKHVLIEKPMALTIEDVCKQQKAVKHNKVKSLVGFVLHWNPLLMTIDRLIDEGAFGDIFMVEVDYLHRIWFKPSEKWYANLKQSGTALLLAGCHAVDAMRWFARSQIKSVSAYHTKTKNPVQYPGTISVNVCFENGRLGRTTTTFDAQMPYRFNIGVYGTDAVIRNNEFYCPKMFSGQNDFARIPCALPDSGDVAHHPFRGEVSHLIDCIIEDKRPFPDVNDAAMTHLACFAADISARQNGKPVAIKELQQ